MRVGAIMLVALLAFSAYLIVTADNPDPRGVALAMPTGGDPAQGRLAIERHGCGTCHVIPGVPGARGTVGAPLSEFARRQYIAGALPNNPDNLARWIVNAQAIEPGTVMPDLPVSEEEARDIVAYLATLR